MSRIAWWLPLVGVLTACGGGGGTAPPPPNVAENLYVRESGNDADDGLTPDKAFRQVATAASHTTPGDTVIVGPGRYRAVNITHAGTDAQPITFVADPTGQMTGDAPGEVILDAANTETAFKVSGANQSHIIIDGFTVINAAAGSTGGVEVKSDASNVIVRNCVARDNLGHGIRIAGATNVTVVNNLIYRNGGLGIHVLGGTSTTQILSLNARVFNNTIFGNAGGGIDVGNSDHPARDTMFINNVIDSNNGLGFNVFTNPPSSLDGLVERYNLSTDDFGSGITKSPQDLMADPLFLMPGSDFHLAQTPAQPMTSPAVDAGDPNTPDDIKAVVSQRTTTSGGGADTGAVDLGYHYPH